jgi:hypothetical protein
MEIEKSKSCKSHLNLLKVEYFKTIGCQAFLVKSTNSKKVVKIKERKGVNFSFELSKANYLKDYKVFEL